LSHGKDSSTLLFWSNHNCPFSGFLYKSALTGCKQTLDEVRSTEVDPIAEKSISNEPKLSEQRINSCVCDEETSRLVARAYVLSIPFLGRENELPTLMASNSSYFTADGRAIQCMQSLGTTIWQRGSARLDEANEDRDRAIGTYGGSMPEGLGDLPGQVGDSRRSYAGHQLRMGQELLWLSQVLPYAVQGNYAPYNDGTTNRQMDKQQLSMLCQIAPNECQIMQAELIKAIPVLEEQIYVLARVQSEGNCQN
jgi:hypothetical protein